MGKKLDAEHKALRKAAFKVVRLSEKIHGYSGAAVDDAIRDLAIELRKRRRK